VKTQSILTVTPPTPIHEETRSTHPEEEHSTVEGKS